MQKSSKPLGIKDWKDDDKPREKLMLRGRSALSDAELLAILIGSGNTEDNAVSLCQKILAGVENNLQLLGRMEINELKKFKGIGTAKALTIMAALELGRRRRLEEALSNRKINGSRDVFEIMQPLLGDLPHEEFWIVYLNNANKVLAREKISAGGITGTLVDTRIIFKKGLEVLATAVILCHNHPSGMLKPSESDLQLTKKIKEAGTILDIRILDHLIITDTSFYSFADEGKL